MKGCHTKVHARPAGRLPRKCADYFVKHQSNQIVQTHKILIISVEFTQNLIEQRLIYFKNKISTIFFLYAKKPQSDHFLANKIHLKWRGKIQTAQIIYL